MYTKKIPTDATLIRALVVLAPKMPAHVASLGAGRGHSRHMKALETKGWVVYHAADGWRLTSTGEAIYAANT